MMNTKATRQIRFALILIIVITLLLFYNGYNCFGNTTHILSYQFNNGDTSDSGSSGIPLPASFASHYSGSKDVPLSSGALNLFYSSFQCVGGNPGDMGTQGSWGDRQCIFHNVCVQGNESSSLGALNLFYSSFQCVGGNPGDMGTQGSWGDRQCIFHNVCVQGNESSPVYIVDYFYPASISSLSSTIIRVNDIFLGLRHGLPGGRDASKLQVRLVPMNHSDQTDPNRNLRYLDETYLMYQILPEKDMNFGHVLFDDAFGLYAILRQFRATRYNSPTKNHVLVFEACEDFEGHLNELCVKFTKGIFPTITSHPIRSIDSLFDSSVNSNRICFRELVAGQGASGAIGWGPKNFNRAQIFFDFRTDLLLTHRINPNIIPKQHHILLVNKKGRRRFHNLDEIYKKILSTPRYAGIKITIADDFKDLTITQQLELFQTVTIAITPCGGISLLFFFLPRQSVLIVSGYPYMARMEAQLWDYQTHLRVIHYSIQSNDEFVLSPEYKQDNGVALRNRADIILKTEKLFALIDKAIVTTAMKSS
ncbi:unnamed protein product [Adineta steineri]|uniref:Glycosyltransferase 61 catalytic domain-containing protein n=2 Tax=Adineta steineri TaxID=433720 RepID=A0A815NF21_9BILA|nr:unnamed protein product [Adineta steineri]